MNAFNEHIATKGAKTCRKLYCAVCEKMVPWLKKSRVEITLQIVNDKKLERNSGVSPQVSPQVLGSTKTSSQVSHKSKTCSYNWGRRHKVNNRTCYSMIYQPDGGLHFSSPGIMRKLFLKTAKVDLYSYTELSSILNLFICILWG